MSRRWDWICDFEADELAAQAVELRGEARLAFGRGGAGKRRLAGEALVLLLERRHDPARDGARRRPYPLPSGCGRADRRRAPAGRRARRSRRRGRGGSARSRRGRDRARSRRSPSRPAHSRRLARKTNATTRAASRVKPMMCQEIGMARLTSPWRRLARCSSTSLRNSEVSGAVMPRPRRPARRLSKPCRRQRSKARPAAARRNGDRRKPGKRTWRGANAGPAAFPPARGTGPSG